jgi:glutathione transport system permease protein
VVSEIGERLPFTLGLAITAYLIAIGLGVPAGMIAAIYRHGWPDQAVMILAIMGASVANFWLALMAMNRFSVQLGWLPLLGATSWESFIMPSVTLAVLPTAVIARMTRSSMIEVMNQDFIRTAYAKGVTPARIYWNHALRNALIPIITIVGLNFGSLIGGAVVTESVFNWPGLGRFLVDAVRYRDYPVIQGVTLVAVTGVVLMNFFAELLIAVVNPRIRLD